MIPRSDNKLEYTRKDFLEAKEISSFCCDYESSEIGRCRVYDETRLNPSQLIALQVKCSDTTECGHNEYSRGSVNDLVKYKNQINTYPHSTDVSHIFEPEGSLDTGQQFGHADTESTSVKLSPELKELLPPEKLQVDDKSMKTFEGTSMIDIGQCVNKQCPSDVCCKLISDPSMEFPVDTGHFIADKVTSYKPSKEPNRSEAIDTHSRVDTGKPKMELGMTKVEPSKDCGQCSHSKCAHKCPDNSPIGAYITLPTWQGVSTYQFHVLFMLLFLVFHVHFRKQILPRYVCPC